MDAKTSGHLISWAMLAFAVFVGLRLLVRPPAAARPAYAWIEDCT